MLKQIADVFQTAGRYQVDHLGGQRLQAVTANVIGRDVRSFVAEAEETLNKKLQLPSGVHLEFAGSAQAQAQAQRDLIMNSLVAGLGILILLIVVTGSSRNVLLVLANMPFAMVGGVLAVFATGGVLTLGSMVGFVTLFGITLRNSIMMISHYEHLVGVEGVRVGAGGGHRRCRRPARTDPHDVHRHGARPVAAGRRHERAGPRDRGADGAGHRRRPRHLDGAQSLGVADARPAVRQVRRRKRPRPRGDRPSPAKAPGVASP